jgi:hypothetical protein
MPVNFLEQLVAEWYEYRGYFVRRNVLVGKRAKGGYECELDVVAFHPGNGHLVHVEPSTDASSWEKREHRFRKKFEAGRRYVPGLFQGLLSQRTSLEQYALLALSAKSHRSTVGGAKLRHVADLLAEITDHFSRFHLFTAAVPEQYPILRTLQFTTEFRDRVFSRQANPRIHADARKSSARG